MKRHSNPRKFEDAYGNPLQVGDVVAYNAHYKGSGTKIGTIIKFSRLKVSIREQGSKQNITDTRYPDDIVKGYSSAVPTVIVIKRPDEPGYLVYGPFATPDAACDWGNKNLSGDDWMAEPVTSI